MFGSKNKCYCQVNLKLLHHNQNITNKVFDYYLLSSSKIYIVFAFNE